MVAGEASVRMGQSTYLNDPSTRTSGTTAPRPTHVRVQERSVRLDSAGQYRGYARDGKSQDEGRHREDSRGTVLLIGIDSLIA